jgi:hypothetical protein
MDETKSMRKAKLLIVQACNTLQLGLINWNINLPANLMKSIYQKNFQNQTKMNQKSVLLAGRAPFIFFP